MRPEIEQAAKDAGCVPRRHPEHRDDVQVFATPDALVKFYDSAFKAGAEQEREACAKLCWSQRKYWDAEACADAIRARGSK